MDDLSSKVASRMTSGASRRSRAPTALGINVATALSVPASATGYWEGRGGEGRGGEERGREGEGRGGEGREGEGRGGKGINLPIHLYMYMFTCTPVGSSVFNASVTTNLTLLSDLSSTVGKSKEEHPVDPTKPNDHPVLKVWCVVLLRMRHACVCTDACLSA